MKLSKSFGISACITIAAIAVFGGTPTLSAFVFVVALGFAFGIAALDVD